MKKSQSPQPNLAAAQAQQQGKKKDDKQAPHKEGSQQLIEIIFRKEKGTSPV